MRAAHTYRGARKREARKLKMIWRGTTHRRVTLVEPMVQTGKSGTDITAVRKGRAIVLKSAGDGVALKPDPQRPGYWLFA